MTVQSRAYFIISGIISFVILFIAFAASVYILFTNEKIKTYALKKDNFISISLNNIPKTTKKVIKKSVKKKVVKKVIDTPIIDEDIGSLFSNVATKKIIHKKREIKKRRIDKNILEAVNKEFNTLKENKVDNNISKKLEELKLRNSKVALVNQKASTALDINEFLASLQAFIYDKFYPPVNSSGNSAVVRIWISKESTLSRFIIIAPSNNDYFDDEIKSLERRLSSVKFPTNPQKKEMVIDITLVAKE